MRIRLGLVFHALAWGLFPVMLALLMVGASLGQSQAPGEPKLDASNHRLAEGDYLLVQFDDGQERFEHRVQVDSAGEILLPLLGTVPVEGMTPRAAADLLTEQYRTYYHHPSAAIQVLEYGRFEVFVFGPDFPGAIHQLNSRSRLLDLLERLELEAPGIYRRLHVVRGGFDFTALSAPDASADGVSANGNTLAIPSPGAVTRSTGSLASFTNWRPWLDQRLRDVNSEVWIIDPLSLTLEGELSRYNLELNDQDVVYIPTPERFIDLEGVANPGRYELLQEETLGEILRLAGTVDYLNDLANAVVQRYDECGRLERVIFNLYPALDDLSCIERFTLRNRDRIRIMGREGRIFVLGEVNEAGAFPFAEDSTVLDYLAQAKGETPEAHLAWIAIIRQGRDRLDPAAPAEVIQANFKEIHKGLPHCTDISLLPGDVIYVPPKGREFKLSELLQATSTLATTYALVESRTSSSSSK